MKMTARELKRLALHDAITLQHTLIDVHGIDTTAGISAGLRAAQYRDLLEKGYGKAYTPEEIRRARSNRALVAPGKIR